MYYSPSLRLLLSLFTLIVASVGITYAFIEETYSITGLLAIIIVFTVIHCVNLYNKVTLKMTFMFDAIENEDMTFRFKDSGKIAMQEQLLNNSLNRIKELVIKARNEVKEREHFYEIILNRVDTGVIIMNDNGIIFSANEAALLLLRMTRLTHINQTETIAKEIPEKFHELTAGNNDTIKFYDEVSEVSINISATYVDTPKGRMKVVILSDIAGQIEETETQSWTRLSRVLTHEIMNSLSPINSLSQALLITDDDDIRQRGLEVIHSTSTGLMKFVENYRNMTRIPVPAPELINVENFINERAELYNNGFRVDILATNLEINADKGLIAQVVTNLIKNGTEATIDTDGEVWLRIGRTSRGKIFIDVCNNGVPIAEEVLKNIFVPFFSTKNGSSGIGLSLSRQIMQLHGGTLTASTHPHTTFRMEFPATS